MYSAEGTVCPFCEGKGYILVEVFPNGDFVTPKTWARKDCPLCQGVGRLFGSTGSRESKESDK